MHANMEGDIAYAAILTAAVRKFLLDGAVDHLVS